jgi:hypothetical protein
METGIGAKRAGPWDRWPQPPGEVPFAPPPEVPSPSPLVSPPVPEMPALPGEIPPPAPEEAPEPHECARWRREERPWTSRSRPST